MSYYRFDWNVFATDDVVTQLLMAAGLHTPDDVARDSLRPAVAQVLSAVGGLNVATRSIPAGQRTAIAERMLRDAIGAVLKPVRAHGIPGVDFTGSAPKRVTACVRIPLNSAPAADIELLPGIGAALAARIIEERGRRPFRGLSDLAYRVDGIGEALARRIGTMVTFALPPLFAGVPPPVDLSQDFASLVAGQGLTDPVAGAHSALAVVLVNAQTSPTPAPPVLLGAEVDADTGATTLVADEIIVLSGSSYYNELRRMFAAASSRIEVCMFHIAMPGEDHPTRRLLEALVAARQRGVTVRVLVDRDRDEDPYRSTVINEDAVAYLADAGVRVRQDPPDMLLHSKFVLIDGDRTLIGSHNWTAGSYFVFDDLTLSITSTAVATAQRRRFNALWEAAADG